MRAFVAEVKDYIRFGEEEERVLRTLGPWLAPIFPAVVDDFYARILAHPGAGAALTGGQPQIDRLKGSLTDFLETFVSGPWDDAYFDKRARIGRRHVVVGLRQRYMLTAMAAIREHLCTAALELLAEPRDGITATRAVAAINKLCDLELAVMLRTYREDTQRKLKTSERLATFGEMVSAICHELRNPLGVIESSIFLLKRREQEERNLKHLDRIQRQVRRSTRIISNMLDIVRDAPVSVSRVTPQLLCERARDTLNEELALDIRVEVPDGLPPVETDVDLTLQVLLNLLHNAVEAAPERAESIQLSARFDGEQVLFVVRDAGPGIPEHVKDRLFEPLVTTKESGIGLGLALSSKLARQLQGSLQLLEGPTDGAAFALGLPTSISRPPSSVPPQHES